MSGGIDSTAVCSMLLEQGYRVEGLTFVTCDAGLRAAEEAAALAARLGIPHHIADVRDEFRKLVIEPFIDAYLRGATPNPCVNCNPEIKFRTLEEWADKLGCKYIATGHYVQLKPIGEKVYICTGDDDRKDQSYFLYMIHRQQLMKSIFPVFLAAIIILMIEATIQPPSPLTNHGEEKSSNTFQFAIAAKITPSPPARSPSAR